MAILKGDIQRLLEQLADARSEAVSSVSALAQIDLVKSRMEAAYDTLKVFSILCRAMPFLVKSAQERLANS